MRALGALVLVVGTATAHAHPVSIRGLKDPFARDYPTPCETSRTWSKVAACLARQGNKVSVVGEVAGAKLVALRYGKTIDATLGLYVLDGGTWTRQSFYASTNTFSELLSFKATESAVYRIEVGMTNATSVQLDEVSPTSATLRRILTTECRRGRGCRTLVTSCDVVVEGKAVLSFRGQLQWTPDNRVKIAGDTRFAGTLCTPARTLIAPVEDVEGDPLE